MPKAKKARVTKKTKVVKLSARARARNAVSEMRRPSMGSLTPAQFSFQYLHQRSWDATSFFEAAEAGMQDIDWQNGAESFKLRNGSLLEESTTLHADFDTKKKLVVLYSGARFLSARSLAMQNALLLMAEANKWKSREVKELRLFTTSENPAQSVKRNRTWLKFIEPKLDLLPVGYKVNQLN